MNHDINVKATRINCFRQSKVAGEFMLQLRVPGSIIDAKHLKVVQEIAEKWGDGTFHIGMRHTLNLPGIKYPSIPEVNAFISEYIKEVEVVGCDIDMETEGCGYPTIGSRNIMSCIGNTHCIKANINTHELAKKIEKEVFPSHYHIKATVAGCPNDCAKAHFNDFGVVGIAKMEYDRDRCIGCGACADACSHHATGVLKLENGKIEKDTCCCVGCGECTIACPTSAWTRKPQKFYRILIGGRTGKQTPRMGRTFANWLTEDVVIAIFRNWPKFSAWVLDNQPLYLHGGHLIDTAGYQAFKEHILEGIELNPEATIAERVFWTETEYKAQINLKPYDQHEIAGPRPEGKKGH